MKRVNNFIRKIIISDDSKTGARKFLNSIWAIFLGLAISSIFILVIGKNPFNAFQELINGAESLKEETWTYFAIYAFGAMAIGVAFKAGLFNIGVPGQMMAGGIAAYLIIQKLGNTNTESLILGLVVSIGVGAFIAVLVGILKSYLNIHEVVSTIMLNWIIFYLGKYIFRSGTKYNDNGYEKSVSMSIESQAFNLNNYSWIISIILVIIISLFLLFIMKKTTIGYKIKSIGVNKDASKYSGFKDKLLISGTLCLSGALAGISGFFYYIVKQSGSIDFASGQPLSYGFDSIAISLLAYNSMIGIPLTSILYSYLQSGQARLELETGIGREFYAIIVGIIVYLAAIAIVFSKFKPANFSIRRIIFLIFPKYRLAVFDCVKKYKKTRSKIKLEILQNKKYYLANKNNLTFKSKKIKKKLKLISNRLIKEKMNVSQSKKMYFQASQLKLELIELKDSFGYTAYKASKKNLSIIRKKLFSNLAIETDKYTKKLKSILINKLSFKKGAI